ESNQKSAGFHAFVYSQGKLTDLGALIEATHGKKPIESVAYGINSGGQGIGRYYPTDANGKGVFRSFLATPILNLFGTLLHDVTGVGPGKSFHDKVTQAQQAYVAQNKSTTCSALSALQREISAQTGKKVTATTAAALQTETAGLKQTLSCP